MKKYEIIKEVILNPPYEKIDGISVRMWKSPYWKDAEAMAKEIIKKLRRIK